MASTPPGDPEEWSDEQWLAWLAEIDAEIDAETPPESDSEDHVTALRERLPVGAQLLYAGMFGLYQAIYGTPREEPALIIEASGDPDEPESLEVHLDRNHPGDSTVVLRPWLFGRRSR